MQIIMMATKAHECQYCYAVDKRRKKTVKAASFRTWPTIGVKHAYFKGYPNARKIPPFLKYFEEFI